jgi:hypothetical protein
MVCTFVALTNSMEELLPSSRNITSLARNNNILIHRFEKLKCLGELSALCKAHFRYLSETSTYILLWVFKTMKAKIQWVPTRLHGVISHDVASWHSPLWHNILPPTLLKGTSRNFVVAAYTNINDKSKFRFSRYDVNTGTQDADRNFHTESKTTGSKYKSLRQTTLKNGVHFKAYW